MTRRLVTLSKLLSFMLRHEPAKFGLVLDAEGFTPLDEVLSAVQQSLPDTTVEDLDKQLSDARDALAEAQEAVHRIGEELDEARKAARAAQKESREARKRYNRL